MIDQSLREALAHLPRAVVFVELARLGSFRETAKVLGLSPSTVTHHIKALEEALGVRLVERTSRSMMLTAAGHVFLAEARDVAGVWTRGAEGARAHADAAVGTLVVTAPDQIAERYVVPAIGRLVAQHEQVEVDLRVTTERVDIIAERIDVAIRSGPLPDSGHGVRLLHRGRHSIVATPALAAKWPATHPKELGQAPWVRFIRHPDTLELMGPDGATHDHAPRSRTRASSAGTFVGLVCVGAGFGVVPRSLIPDQLADGRLQVVLPEWSRGTTNFYAVTPSPKATDLKVRLFTDLLIQAFQGQG